MEVTHFCRIFADVNYLSNQRKYRAMMNSTTLQGVYVNVPKADWSLFRELVRKFGWQTETREQLLNRFVESRPELPTLSEDDIMDEVRAVRYGK